MYCLKSLQAIIIDYIIIILFIIIIIIIIIIITAVRRRQESFTSFHKRLKTHLFRVHLDSA